MNKITLALAMGMLALTACTADDGTDDTVDTGTAAYEGPWQVETFNWSCDATGYTYTVENSGWADGVTLDIFETGAWGGLNDPNTNNGWEENGHNLAQVFSEDDGSADRWEVSLDSVTTTGAVVAGDTTLFACDTHGEDELAWMITGDFGENGEDCVVFGNEAADWFNTTEGNSCVDIN